MNQMRLYLANPRMIKVIIDQAFVKPEGSKFWCDAWDEPDSTGNHPYLRLMGTMTDLAAVMVFIAQFGQ